MSLTSIRFAVLGMLKMRPMTGYEIKQAYQKGPANFMPISFGQIYPALAKLGKEKLVRQDRQPGSRGSIRYFITGKGEEALRSWLFSPSDPANHRELLLPRWRGSATPSRRSAKQKKRGWPITKTHTSGWTIPTPAIRGCRSGSWSWSTGFCKASPACAGRKGRWRL